MDSIVERDEATRANPVTWDGAALTISHEEPVWERQGFTCQACGADVQIPDGLELD